MTDWKTKWYGYRHQYIDIWKKFINLLSEKQKAYFQMFYLSHTLVHLIKGGICSSFSVTDVENIKKDCQVRNSKTE